MKYLLDTHLLLWAALAPERLPLPATQVIEQASNHLFFSSASVWEVAIKRAKGLTGFNVDPREWHESLLAAGYIELPVTGQHGLQAGALPFVHKDPFDRLLVAQAIVEELILMTSDKRVSLYKGRIELV